MVCKDTITVALIVIRMIAKRFYRLFISGVLCMALGIAANAQSSDLGTIIRLQSSKLSEQSKEIERLKDALEVSRQETERARRRADKLRADWDNAIAAKSLLSQADVDSIFLQLARQREQLDSFNMQNRELQERNKQLECELNKMQPSMQSAAYSSSFLGSKQSYILLLLFLSFVSVYLFLKYRKVRVKLGNKHSCKFRAFISKCFSYRKRHSLPKVHDGSPEEEVALEGAIFAETIARSGIFVRVSVQQSDEKKYVLQVLASNPNRAIFVLNYDSRYYTLWLQNAERFLVQGVEVVCGVQKMRNQQPVEINSGSAIRLNGAWRVERPVQLKFA